MISIGIDIVEIADIQLFFKENTFQSRAFTIEEIAYCSIQARPDQHFSARFAAKEAFMKALGTGWNLGIQWTQIEVVHNENKKPLIKLSKTAEEIFSQQGYNNIALSLSHSRNYAVATVLISS